MPNIYVEKTQKLTITQIKALTPYLDNFSPRLTNLQRAFVWYYCHNGFSAANAAKLAGYKSGSKRGKVNKKSTNLYYAVQGNENLNHAYIIDAVQLVVRNIVDIEKNSIEPKLFENWMSQAFYDPALFVNPDGTIAFRSWDEIPQQYHCCVISIEKKYYGRNADKEVIVIKLADKKYAQDKLDKLIQLTKEPSEIDVNLKEETLDRLENILSGKKRKKK